MKVIVATGNAGKMREFKRILEPLGFAVTSMKEEGISLPIEETGATFAENARIKRWRSTPTPGGRRCRRLGISVDALDGRRGSTPPGTAGRTCPTRKRSSSFCRSCGMFPRSAGRPLHLCHLLRPAGRPHSRL